MLQAIGKYKVQRLLGEGAMGAVYLAEDPDIGRPVAIKVMKVGAEEDHERFRQEARVVGGLSHPNIVVLHDFGFHEGKPYLVMQYLPGSSLEVWLRSPHALPEHLRVMEGLVAALDYAHGRGVLHRDVKPSNVQVTPEGDGLLMDFGIARVPEAKLTATGAVLGTPAYMAPEILGDAQYSTRADNYSAALVLYEMLAGKNPFLGQSVSSTLTSVLTLEPPDLRALRPDAPRELAAAIATHLAKDPRARPADLAGLLATLRALRAGVLEPAAAAARASTATQSVRQLDAEVAVQVRTDAARRAATARPSVSTRGRAAWLAAAAVAAAVVAAWLAARPTHPPAASPAATPIVPTGTAPAPAPRPPATPAGDVATGASASPRPAAAETAPTRRVPSVRPSPVASPSRPPRATSQAADDAAGAPVAATSPPAATLAAAPAPGPTPTPPRVAEAAASGTVADPAPRLAELSPRTCRRGSVAAFDLRGSGFRGDHRARVVRGGREVPGLQVTRLALLAPEHLRITLFVGADVPLGSYSVVLVDSAGALSDAITFEVVL